MSLRVPTLTLVLTAALAVSSCGSSGQPLATAPPVTEPLPTLPPAEERDPELFDAEGCLRTDAETADCTTSASDIDAALAGAGETDWRTLAGFVGSQWTTEPSAGGMTVLTQTLDVSREGTWSARGLLRNEGASEVSGLVVHARLFDAGGGSLGEVSAPVPVPMLRPGEPAPFQIGSEVAAAQVADVEWLTSIATPDGTPAGPGGTASRDLELTTHWQRGLADPRPVDSYLFRDPPDSSHPYVAMGSAANLGDTPLSTVGVVAAFVDGSGRVLWVQEAAVVAVAPGTDLDALAAPLVDADGRLAAEGGTPVGTGGSADFLVVVSAADAPVGLDQASVFLWGWGW